MENIDLEQMDNEELLELLEIFKGMQDEIKDNKLEKEGEKNEYDDKK